MEIEKTNIDALAAGNAKSVGDYLRCDSSIAQYEIDAIERMVNDMVRYSYAAGCVDGGTNMAKVLGVKNA